MLPQQWYNIRHNCFAKLEGSCTSSKGWKAKPRADLTGLSPGSACVPLGSIIDKLEQQSEVNNPTKYVVYAQYLLVSLHRSGCVLEIVAPERRPPEDVRESRLRGVTEHHCHSAKGFNWKALQPKKKKKSSLHCSLNPFPQSSLTHTHTHCYNWPARPLSPWSPRSQTFLLNEGGMKVVSQRPRLIADILWKWPSLSLSLFLSAALSLPCSLKYNSFATWWACE